MAKGKSTWKYNKLLTARRNYFDGLSGSSALERIETPSDAYSYTSPVVPTSLPRPQADTNTSNAGGGSNVPGLMGGIASIGMEAAASISGLINNINSDDVKEQASGMIKQANAQQMKRQGANDSFDSLMSDMLNTGQIAHVTNKQLGAKNFGQGMGDAIAAGTRGFAAGASLGPVAGGIAAGANTLLSIIGNSARNSVIKNQVKKINKAIDYTNAFNDRSLLGRASNLAADQLSGLEANYAAFGGPIDFGGGAIGYDFMNQYLGIKELAALGQDGSLSSLPNSFAEGGGIHIKPSKRGTFTATAKKHGMGVQEFAGRVLANKEDYSPAMVKKANFARNASKWKYAFGGNLLTHGANFDTGLTYIDNGGSHEENPYEGVLMGIDPEGTPNLVEEGETIFNDYVFSKRLKVPKSIRDKYKLGKKDISFADASKKLAKESEERPNDPISQRGLQALMSDLANAQEEIKAIKQSNKYSNGGKVNKYDGESQPSQKLRTYSNYEQLGQDTDFYTPEYLEFWEYMKDPNNIDEANKWLDLINSGKFGSIGGNTFTLNDIQRLSKDFKKGPVHNAYAKAAREYSTRKLKKDLLSNVPLVDEEVNIPGTGSMPISPIDTQDETATDAGTLPVEDPEDQVSKLPTWMRYAPVAGLGLGVLTDTLGLTNKPNYSNAEAILEATKGASYQPVEFNPIGNYLGYTPFDREFYINQMNAQAGATRRAIMQNAGLNRGAGMAALLASDYNAQGQLGQLARQAEEYNLAQRQTVEDFNRATNMFNSEGFLKADMANQEAQAKLRDSNLRGIMAAAEMKERARMFTDQNKAANLSGLLQSLGDIGAENEQKNWRNAMYLAGVFGGKMDPRSAYLMGLGPKPTSAKKDGKLKRKKGLTI